MEMFWMFIMMGIVLSVILSVEFLMYRRPLTEEQIAQYQQVLDEKTDRWREEFDLDVRLDARVELLQAKRQKKARVIFAAAMLIVLVFMLLIFLDRVTIDLSIAMCSAGIVLLSYGMIKIAESKKTAIAVLVVIILLSLLISLYV
jgi:hypothetical protein